MNINAIAGEYTDARIVICYQSCLSSYRTAESSLPRQPLKKTYIYINFPGKMSHEDKPKSDR